MRIKWLKISITDQRFSYKKLCNALNKYSYSDGNPKGFIVDELRDNYIQARYISKRSVMQEVETPLGEIIKQEIISYDTTVFRISDKSPQLELKNPSRSITDFINQLSLANNFNISVSDLTVDLEQWIKNIQENTNVILVLKSFECTDIQLGKDLKGILTISGSGDIRNEIRKIIGAKKYNLKRVGLSINNASIVLGNNCSINITSGGDDHVLQVVRDSLPSV